MTRMITTGPIFLYFTGTIQLLCVTEPEMVKEMSLCTSLSFGKPSYLSTERGPLLGRGILTSNGPYWEHQRKIIAPEFYLERVKVPKKMNWETKCSSILPFSCFSLLMNFTPNQW